MILTILSGKKIFISSDDIWHVSEKGYNTIVNTKNGEVIMVKESFMDILTNVC